MRAVKEWIGKTDDTMPPPRVRVRIFDRYQGVCQCGCGTKIRTGDKWDVDHVIAIANGGENTESNLRPILTPHHRIKTRADRKKTKKIARARRRHLGLKRKSRLASRKSKIPSRSWPLSQSRSRRKSGRSQRTVRRRSGDTVQSSSLSLSAAAPERYSFEVVTERLRILPQTGWIKEHLEAMNNKQHMQFSEQRHFHHTERTQIDAIRSGKASNSPLYYIINRSSGAAVGSMGFTIDERNRLVDMSIMIFPEHTNKGYGLEAWRAMLDYWLDPERGDMDKVEAGHVDANLSMMNICAKSEMKHEGYRNRHFQFQLFGNETRADLCMWGKHR